MARNFLGDEVHLLQSDIAILRSEGELLKMACERKDGELSVLREELTKLKIAYEEKLTEAIAIQTILEQVSNTLVTGLSQHTERRRLRAEHHEEEEEEETKPKLRPGAAFREGQRAYEEKRGLRPVAVVEVVENDPPPQFLQRPPTEWEPRRDSRMPTVDLRSDVDELRDHLGIIGTKGVR